MASVTATHRTPKSAKRMSGRDPSAQQSDSTSAGTSTASDTEQRIEDLLATYRTVPHVLPGRGEPPVQTFPGRIVEAGQREVLLRSTPNFGQPGVRQAVYVHGLGGAARNWTDLMHLLAPVAGGIAPDLPGFGKSSPPKDGDYSLPAHAQVVVRLIEDRCVGPVDLFGNSMGGAIATRIAALRPDLVRTLTLVSPALPDLRPKLSVAPIILQSTPLLRDVARRVLRTGDPERAVDRMHEACYADPSLVSAARRDEQIEETAWRLRTGVSAVALRQSARGLVDAYIPGRPGYLWPLAERVECPTLAIFGTHDKLVDSRLADRAARSFRNGRVVTLPEMGHVAQLEAPEKVAQMVLTMWADTHA